MNHYVVGRATRGLANYFVKKHPGEQLKACIACDTRLCSREFAQHSAGILSACGFRAYLFAEARPTPMLSFAVRHLKAHTGIVITASHNPREYNGYKAYGPTGGQLTDEAAGEVLAEINALDLFDTQAGGGAPGGQGAGEIVLLDEAFDEIYYRAIEPFLLRREMSVARGGELKLLYSPLHGAGLTPVTDMLARLGYSNLHIAESQKYQDAAHSFPTVKKPNPEEPEVFGPALEIAKDLRPDVIFATDPDADRIGVLALDENGQYVPFTGSQIGALLCGYVIQSYREAGRMPPNPAIITTIVTGTLAQRVCEHPDNQVHAELVLTGFKYIGEKMDQWQASGEHNCIFGFEESYGYLAGDACRDKDAVISSALVAEMALYYKLQGLGLHGALQALYAKYGPVCEDVLNVEAKGAAGAAQISNWMMRLRKNYASLLEGETVVAIEDFSAGIKGLPPSNVLKLYLADGSWLVVRPSGTEPKIKLYACTDRAFGPGASMEEAARRCAEIVGKAKGFFV
ncbi:MAG: phospho-sugar mutase [Oscillospiraceae bacterium]|nr:phospho-sugar mutase [Oscillospiraceae bacterium]